MLVEYYFPQSLSAARLDRYLSGGWFRSGPSLFRAHLLCLEGELYSVVNIRVVLDELKLSRSLRKVLNRGNRNFQVVIGRAQVDEAREALYVQHKTRFKGFIFDSLEEFLFGGVSHYLFDTHEVAVYDKGELVAISYFDRGENGIASLIGLYQDGYERYSLGLFTMLHEVQFGQTLGHRFYYPGYVLKGYDGFDYKLRLGNIQYYNWNGRWRPLNRISEEEFSSERLKKAIFTAEAHLKAYQVAHRRIIYPFFSVGYLGMVQDDFIRSAMFLEIRPGGESSPEVLVIEYILEDEVYQISRVDTDRDYMDFIDANFSEDFFSWENSQTGLYIREERLFSHYNIEPIIQFLLRNLPSYHPSKGHSL